MRHISLLGTTGLLVLLASGSSLAASHFKVVFIDQYDQNADGKVSSIEFETARRARFDLTDENHDSSVNAEEYLLEYENRLDAQLGFDRREQVTQTATRFKSLDEDGNGRITRDEYDASGNWSWQRFDSNEDGVIDATDADPMASQPADSDAGRSREQILHDTKRILSMPSTHSKSGTLEQYDSDGDATVTQAEFEAGRKANFERTDSNGDAWLSESEYTYEFEDRLDRQISSTRKGQVDQTLVRFDALDRNEDKRMTFEEYQFSGHRSFTRYDTDGDGYVSFEEADPLEPEFSQEEQAVEGDGEGDREGESSQQNS